MIGYISTRGKAPRLGFCDVTLTGLARDGGLYVPEENMPMLLDGFEKMSYAEIASRVMTQFIGSEIPKGDLEGIIDAAYKSFSHKDIAPLKQLEDNFYLLELFHGPTFAFKDVALQLLGHLFEYILTKRQERVTIVAATSGDTGSAAIEAFKGRENVNIVVLHPHNRVSEVQRRQMTTVTASNVSNIAIEGSFDDCQDLVKAMFNDQKFRDEMQLSAVNSINWARILAQVVYYVYASSRIGKPLTFCVPTGNFGNIYAGYMARSIGVPVKKLLVATNRNDILHRFFQTGEMKANGVAPSLSPSMDIQISSNFERLLFELYHHQGSAVNATMRLFRDAGSFHLDPETMSAAKSIFASGRVDDETTLKIIKSVYEKHNYIIDPHTAVGVGVAKEYQVMNKNNVVVSLATAHPAKFPDAVKAAIGIEAPVPPALAKIFKLPETYEVLPADLARVQQFVRDKVKV